MRSTFWLSLLLLAPFAAAQTEIERSVPKLSLAAAIQATLAGHPILEIQKDQIQISRAAKQQASSAFDLRLSSGANQSRITTPLTQADRMTALQAGIAADHQGLNYSQVQAGFDKQFRSGLVIAPGFSMLRNADNLTSLLGRNSSHTGITVILPLMRGRGYAAVGAQELASSVEVKATQLDVSHTAASLISNTAASYWNYLAALRGLEIAIGSENRGRSLIDNVQAFIDAGRSPRSDLNEVVANLADRVSTRIAAEQRVVSAKVQLAYDMGLHSDALYMIGQPSTLFPAAAAQPPPSDNIAIDYYSTEAFRLRADLLAAQQRIEEADHLATGAKNRLKPQVNLNFSFGYSGLREGLGFGPLLQSPFSGVRGADATGGLSYSFTPANDLATGQLRQAEAQVRQAQSRALDIRRRIRASVLSAVEGVRHQAERLSVVQNAVQAFEAALDGQRERYRLGLNSVVDILTMEDRLTNALSGQVQAQLSYALAITDFRFATGTILSPFQLQQTVDEDVFLTVPFGGASIPTRAAPLRNTTEIPRSQDR